MKKKVLVSACLLGINCRYDGGHSYLNELENDDVDFYSVCPEESGGLGTPRPKAEMQDSAEDILSGNGKIVNINSKDVTKEFIQGAQLCLNTGIEAGAKFAILKSKSPSCGLGEVYDGSFKGKLQKGDGIFAHLCRKSGLSCISSDNISEIKNTVQKPKQS